jgi:hypothetical protein
MRGMIGCAGVISAVALVPGLIGSAFATNASPAERLMIALMPAGMTFIAALMLFSRDRARHRRTVRRVRDRLMARADASDDDFSRGFPGAESALLLQTRLAIATFFGVPIRKIHPTDHLRSDLEFAALEPSFHSFVVCHILNARNVEPKPFSFRTADLADLRDLVAEIQRVLDGLGATNAPEGNMERNT